MATDYSTNCRMRHIPAKKDDWVYVRGYPGPQEVTGGILILGDLNHGPYREIPIRVELLRVKDKGFIS